MISANSTMQDETKSRIVNENDKEVLKGVFHGLQIHEENEKKERAERVE